MPNYNILSRISGETKCTKTVQMLPVGSLWLLRLRARARSSAPFCPSSVLTRCLLPRVLTPGTRGRSTPERSRWALTLGLSLVHCLI